jgi:hypothetical protein
VVVTSGSDTASWLPEDTGGWYYEPGYYSSVLNDVLLLGADYGSVIWQPIYWEGHPYSTFSWAGDTIALEQTYGHEWTEYTYPYTCWEGGSDPVVVDGDESEPEEPTEDDPGVPSETDPPITVEDTGWSWDPPTAIEGDITIEGTVSCGPHDTPRVDAYTITGLTEGDVLTVTVENSETVSAWLNIGECTTSWAAYTDDSCPDESDEGCYVASTEVSTETIEFIVQQDCWDDGGDGDGAYTLHIDSAEYVCGDEDACADPDFSAELYADDQPAWVELGTYSESETIVVTGVLTPSTD